MAVGTAEGRGADHPGPLALCGIVAPYMADVFTVIQAAAYLGIHRDRVYKLIDQGKLQAYRVRGSRGVVLKRSDLDRRKAWIAKLEAMNAIRPGKHPGGSGQDLPHAQGGTPGLEPQTDSRGNAEPGSADQEARATESAA